MFFPISPDITKRCDLVSVLFCLRFVQADPSPPRIVVTRDGTFIMTDVDISGDSRFSHSLIREKKHLRRKGRKRVVERRPCSCKTIYSRTYFRTYTRCVFSRTDAIVSCVSNTACREKWLTVQIRCSAAVQLHHLTTENQLCVTVTEACQKAFSNGGVIWLTDRC